MCLGDLLHRGALSVEQQGGGHAPAASTQAGFAVHLDFDGQAVEINDAGAELGGAATASRAAAAA